MLRNPRQAVDPGCDRSGDEGRWIRVSRDGPICADDALTKASGNDDWKRRHCSRYGIPGNDSFAPTPSKPTWRRDADEHRLQTRADSWQESLDRANQSADLVLFFVVQCRAQLTLLRLDAFACHAPSEHLRNGKTCHTKRRAAAFSMADLDGAVATGKLEVARNSTRAQLGYRVSCWQKGLAAVVS